LKDVTDSHTRTSGSSEYQADGAATEKAHPMGDVSPHPWHDEQLGLMVGVSMSVSLSAAGG